MANDATAGGGGGKEQAPPTSRLSSMFSRSRVLSSLRRLRATEVEIVNQMLRCGPIVLEDQRIMIWQGVGHAMPASELIGQWGTSPMAIAADGLAQVEPRLEGFETLVPTETCAALVEHALHPVINVLERGAGIPLEFSELQRGKRVTLLDEPVEVGFVVYERDLKPLLRGYVRAPADCWRGFEAARLPMLASRRQLVVPVRLGVQVGAARMKARELASLVPGDAVRLRKSANGALRVMLTDSRARPIVRALINDESLTLEYAMTSPADLDPPGGLSADPASAEQSAEDMLSSIECDVTFELGSIRLPVSEVARLRAGQAIRLGLRLQDQPVSVMVSGRPVARGELAALGDELVIVITDTSRLPHV